MGKYQRVFLIVLDSLGIGAMPDAKRFGDTGAVRLPYQCTVAHLNIPNLQKLVGQSAPPQTGTCC